MKKSLLKIDKLIRKHLKGLYIKIRGEITAYVRDEIPFKKLTKESQQILRTLGIYYKKEGPQQDWKD